jgi:hypothetical protein
MQKDGSDNEEYSIPQESISVQKDASDKALARPDSWKILSQAVSEEGLPQIVSKEMLSQAVS